MVKGRDMIYKLYIVPILTRKLSPIALQPRGWGCRLLLILNLGYAAINDHFILQKPIKLTSIAGVRLMISYNHTNIKQTPQIE